MNPLKMFSKSSLARCHLVMIVTFIAELTLCSLSAAPTAFRDPKNVFPKFVTLQANPQPVFLLPGQKEFIFNMYGLPSTLAQFQQLIGVMKEQKLGNGFDPGYALSAGIKPYYDYQASIGWPAQCYPGGYFQIDGGPNVHGPEAAAQIASMDEEGVFAALQFGEWGYYFHNLSNSPSWWMSVFGSQYPMYMHLMKPAGLAGYDVLPTTTQECYDAVNAYFAHRSRDMLGRISSMTGHSHYEAYAGEWGAVNIGLELGENIAFTQSKMAFARGASRQWQLPWSVQISPWFSGSVTTSGPLVIMPDHTARGLDAGHSLSFYVRMWLHTWFSGAAMVTPENSIAFFFESAQAPWTLTTPHGHKASEMFQFIQSHERGLPFIPVAIVMDHLTGYNGFMDKPWGILPITTAYREIRDLFDFQLFPYSDHIHYRPFPSNPELSYLRPTPYGEIYDVQLTNVSAKVLSGYSTILLVGDIDFDAHFIAALETALLRGVRLLMGVRHQMALGDEYTRMTGLGTVEVLDAWVNPVTNRTTAISNSRLAQLAAESLPFEITGDPIQYMVNRTPTSWVVELINNNGVTKFPTQPAVVDPLAVAVVQITCKLPFKSATGWFSQETYEEPVSIEVKVGPGAVEFIEFLPL